MGGAFLARERIDYSQSMLRVPQEQQWQLLKLAEMDNQLNRLRALVNGTELRREAAQAQKEMVRAKDALDVQAGRVEQMRGDVTKVEREAQAFTEQIQEKEARQQAGIGLTSRDLLVLQQEIDTLRASRDTVEATQLELMMELDTAEAYLKQLEHEHTQARDRALQCVKEGKAALESAQAEGMALKQQRTQFAAGLNEAMVTRYEALRTHGSIGVVSMQSDGSLSSGEELGTGEISKLKALPDDVLVEDTERDVLIVRLFSTAPAEE